jgi:hypothetical protein
VKQEMEKKAYHCWSDIHYQWPLMILRPFLHLNKIKSLCDALYWVSPLTPLRSQILDRSSSRRQHSHTHAHTHTHHKSHSNCDKQEWNKWNREQNGIVGKEKGRRQKMISRRGRNVFFLFFCFFVFLFFCFFPVALFVVCPRALGPGSRCPRSTQ